MFEFTSLGFVGLSGGILYLMTLDKKLTPERIKPENDITESYAMNDHLTILNVNENSPLIGKTLQDGFEDFDVEFNVVDILRNDKIINYNPDTQKIKQDDHLVVRGDEDAIVSLTAYNGCELVGERKLNQANLEEDDTEKELIEIIIHIGSNVIR